MLNERRDGGLPRITRFDFLRMDLVPSNVGTEALRSLRFFFWGGIHGVRKDLGYLQLQKWLEAYNYNKNKVANPSLNP